MAKEELVFSVPINEKIEQVLKEMGLTLHPKKRYMQAPKSNLLQTHLFPAMFRTTFQASMLS